jgi:hypothetical protein
MNYPAELGLVSRITLEGVKLDHVDNLGVIAVFVVPKISKPAMFTAMDHTTQHGHFRASYVGGFRVKVLEGVMPKGRLVAKADACLMVDEELSFFEDPVDPALVPWRKGTCLFDAVTIRGNEIRSGEQVGFMLPNCSRIQIFLQLDPGPRAKLEIEALGGEYEARSPMSPLPAMKEIA